MTDGCDGADPDAEEPVTTQPTAAEGGDGPNAAGGATPPAKGAAGAGQGKKGRGREPKKNYAQWAAAGSYKQMKEVCTHNEGATESTNAALDLILLLGCSIC